MSEDKQQPVVSIVVVARGLWDLTKQSLEGLIFTMSQPWELIFINNGSQDETREEFERIAPTWTWANFMGYRAHHYKKGVSLAAAWNKGYTLAEGEHMLFANNDIVYYKHGWWDILRQSLDAGMHLVGIQDMSWYRFRFIEGSLLLASRSALSTLAEGKRIFDTRFQLTCEDVDLSERFLRAGLRIGQANGLQPDYLVHIGHQTIQSLAGKEDTLAIMHESRVRLCKKYGYEPQVND
jgi:glycosyltransferase involved in cell wall biosynthesis